MILPGYETDERRIESSQALHTSLHNFPVSDADPRIKMLSCDGEGRAMAGLLVDNAWKLVVEEITYESSGEKFDQEVESAPFMTTGEMWAIDIESGKALKEYVEFHEGEIQGLVYLAPGLDSRVVDWLVDQVVKIEDKDNGIGKKPEVLGFRSTPVRMMEWAGLVVPKMEQVQTGVTYV